MKLLLDWVAAARKRKREATGKCEGRKSHSEVRPEVVKLVKHLGKPRGKTRPLSLRQISRALAERGFVNERGSAFNPKSVAEMLAA